MNLNKTQDCSPPTRCARALDATLNCPIHKLKIDHKCKCCSLLQKQWMFSNTKLIDLQHALGISILHRYPHFVGQLLFMYYLYRSEKLLMKKIVIIISQMKRETQNLYITGQYRVYTEFLTHFLFCIPYLSQTGTF